MVMVLEVWFCGVEAEPCVVDEDGPAVGRGARVPLGGSYFWRSGPTAVGMGMNRRAVGRLGPGEL